MFFINHKDIENGTAAVVEIEGPLNSETSSDFEEYIRKLMDNEKIYLIIDLKKLSFISSEGIGAALIQHKRIEEKNGAAVFCNLNSEVTALFRILGFNKIFNITETISDALDLIEEKIGYPENRITGEDLPDDNKSFSGNRKGITDPEPDFSGFDEPAMHEDFSFLPDDDIEPFIIECLKCGSLVRIKEKGDHICPFCNAEFNVADDGKALFKIDDMN